MRRWVAILLGALIAFGGISLAAGSADAKTGCPKDKGNGHGNQYPPGQCKAETDRSTVVPGQTLAVWGDGFRPGATVQFFLHSTPASLGSAVAGSSGRASMMATIPGSTSLGAHFISLYDAAGDRYLTANIEVVSASSGDVVTGGTQSGTSSGSQPTQPSGNSSGILATTGAGPLVPLVGGGAALVGLGAMTLLAARRRRSDAVPS